MMVGTYKRHKIVNEEYGSYIPIHLPVDINIESLYGLMEQSAISLSKLDSLADTFPNINLFLYMYVRREAVLSSQIEGTQSSLSDLILFEHDQKPNVPIHDVSAVSRYVEALNYGIKRLEEGFPLCLRLIKEIHAILLRDTRGMEFLPGEFRISQNWVGGTRPGNAIYVPPQPEIMMDYLSNLESYIHLENMPLLIRTAVAHLQFETIHPFLDGNGRVGRLLIILMFYHFGIMKNPLLYLSLYFKENRSVYYALLNEVRSKGNWEDWISFFLKGVIDVSDQASSNISKITTLFHDCNEKIKKSGRQRFSSQITFEYLKKMPIVSAYFVASQLKISVPTARSALNALVNLEIVEVVHIDKKSKVYKFQQYLNILDTV